MCIYQTGVVCFKRSSWQQTGCVQLQNSVPYMFPFIKLNNIAHTEDVESFSLALLKAGKNCISSPISEYKKRDLIWTVQALSLSFLLGTVAWAEWVLRTAHLILI